MRQTWRWFGPHDPVTVDQMLQAGVEGVVSALHHVPPGTPWTAKAIAERQRAIATRGDGRPSGLAWEVVESLPVSEDVKRRTGPWREHLAAYQTSLEALAGAGIEVVCYNFMPVLDWTRTDLAWTVPAHGGRAMRYDHADFAAFDLLVLRRDGAEEDYDGATLEIARERARDRGEPWCAALAENILCGLPGGADRLTLDDLKDHLTAYAAIGADGLRANLATFLEEVVPTAEALGIRLCCHPDDPPYPLLGLPRILSTEADYAALLAAVESAANGITLCSGSLGARPDNDLPGMMARLGHRVHFLHLRNTRRDTDTGRDFYECEHLSGDTDMVALVAAVVDEEARRQAAGRADHSIPMRPDHGQDLCDDIGRGGQPGYPLIGRLRGLAELRGLYAGLTHARA